MKRARYRMLAAAYRPGAPENVCRTGELEDRPRSTVHRAVRAPERDMVRCVPSPISLLLSAARPARVEALWRIWRTKPSLTTSARPTQRVAQQSEARAFLDRLSMPYMLIRASRHPDFNLFSGPRSSRNLQTLYHEDLCPIHQATTSSWSASTQSVATGFRRGRIVQTDRANAPDATAADP